MLLTNHRLEVMQAVEESVFGISRQYLLPVESCWQPTDLLPDPSQTTFFEDLRELQALARELPHDFWAVLVGDTITEEALPTYEAWLMDLEGVHQDQGNAWSSWVRQWTSEENRHGDLLNRYLYLSGRVDMREVEVSTQHLIADGFDIGTSRDPYRTFIYTSFQELATNISHRRVATIAKDAGNLGLAKICGTIAADESRHARAYKEFVTKIFEIDPNEMMLAFEDMMRKRIVMPAGMLRESGGGIGEAFAEFSNAAQRLEVYTTEDYIQILESLLSEWEIESMGDLNEAGEIARDFLVGLPKRLGRLASRVTVPERTHKFKWVRGSE